jgi:hypothetical protein
MSEAEKGMKLIHKSSSDEKTFLAVDSFVRTFLFLTEAAARRADDWEPPSEYLAGDRVRRL